jgi:hypothetical protein
MTASPSPEERLAGIGVEEMGPPPEEEDQDQDNINRNGEADERKPSYALKLIFAQDIKKTVQKPWIIKNVIAKGEISSWIGKPGAAKSSLLLDISVQAGRGIGWRGYVNKGQCGVVYFALERAKLVERRFDAHRQRDGLADIPFAICPQIIDLMDVKCVEIILDTIKVAEDRFGIGVGLAVFDTFNKGIAAGGGDEDKARDQNRVNANMRRVLERIDIHIAGIGHTGKDESKGERGSNARLADLDLLVIITGDDTKIAVIDKANDQPKGKLTTFTLEPFDLGFDDDDDPIRTFIVSREDAKAAPDPRDGGRQKLSDRQRIALRALAEAILALGEDSPTGFPPRGTKVVTEDQWKAEMVRNSLLRPDDRRADQRFAEVRDALVARSLIGIRAPYVWLATLRP